jgi:HEPN domain-containing protein
MVAKPAQVVRTTLPFVAFSHEADRDYLLARMITFLGGGFHSRAGFFAQQACEKYMKAVMVQQSSSYLQTHKLMELAEACAMFEPYFGEADTNATLQAFDYFDQVGRYGAAANYDPLAQDTIELKTAGVSIWTEDHLDRLDGFVHKTRGLLDFTTTTLTDSLKAIVDMDRKSMLLATWQGKQPLRVVLTKKNRYFGVCSA